MIIKQSSSKYRLRIVFPKKVKIEIQLFMGMESPGHTYNITLISFFFVVPLHCADFKKYCLVFKYSIEYSRSTK